MLEKKDLISCYQRTCLLEKWPIVLRKGFTCWKNGLVFKETLLQKWGVIYSLNHYGSLTVK
jgi:hypothetical protein